MAKSSFVAMMKAKPNARGKRSHLALVCSASKCEEDFLVSYSQDYPPKRYCKEHAPFIKGTTSKTTKQRENDALILQLQQMGLIA